MLARNTQLQRPPAHRARHHRTAPHPGPSPRHAGFTVQACFAAPFDAIRQHYASAVLAGLAPRSIVASARLERSVDAMESLFLGPLARRR